MLNLYLHRHETEWENFARPGLSDRYTVYRMVDGVLQRLEYYCTEHFQAVTGLKMDLGEFRQVSSLRVIVPRRKPQYWITRDEQDRYQFWKGQPPERPRGGIRNYGIAFTWAKVLQLILRSAGVIGVLPPMRQETPFRVKIALARTLPDKTLLDNQTVHELTPIYELV